MYGAQTPTVSANAEVLFENDVEMYGAQTMSDLKLEQKSLRMM